VVVGLVLTISSGHSAKYLTDAVAQGRESYYTGAVAAGEPPGRWYGAGAEQLGLSGLVDAQDLTALFENHLDPRDEHFKDPDQWKKCAALGHGGRNYKTADEIYQAACKAEPHADPERRAELLVAAGTQARSNVAFIDLTYSVPKSVTVLQTAFEAMEVKTRNAGDTVAAEAWGAHRQAVENAIWAGNNAMLDFMAREAGYARVGHHGGAAGRFVDAHDWTVASFFQHDSRDHDPQLHIHNGVHNRVLCPDGVWRTLDSRAIHRLRGAGGAIAERTTTEHLAHSMGVLSAMRPDGKAREVVGIRQQICDLVSSRRRAITPKTAELVKHFTAKWSREPNALERDRLFRQATMATRRAKSHEDGESYEARLERWDGELRQEVAGGMEEVAYGVLDLAGECPAPRPWSEKAVLETALADVQSRKAGWTQSDLMRAISDALPDHLGGLTGAEVDRLLTGLTEEGLKLAVPLDTDRPGHAVLPDTLRLADGRSAYDAPGGRLYATGEHLHTERLLLASTTRKGAPALDTAAANSYITGLAEMGIELGVDQAAAVRGILTSGAAVESLVGPAGTGKSFVVGTLATAWQDPALWGGQQRQVFGLATSQIATEVLTGEGLQARNIARWLATQGRLAGGSAAPEDVEWQLRAGDLVVIDESSMADTANLAAIHGHVKAASAKLLLTGDHRQLGAVGAGGAMDLLADAGQSYELTEARRFNEPWERAASLRLRACDPTVLATYHRHGRIVDGGTIEQTEAMAGRAWFADAVAGKHSALIVDTNEQAARLSAQLRVEMIRLGKVEEAGVTLGLQGTVAGVGDMIEARLLAPSLAGFEGNRGYPINREHYRVLEVRDDGSLVVSTGKDGDLAQLGDRMVLPASYVSQHVALGYASTVHCVQGQNVHAGYPVVTPRTNANALYTGASRGREANTMFVVTRTVPEDAPTGTVNQTAHRNPIAVLTEILDGADPARSALAEARESATEARSIRTAAELFTDAADVATAGRTAGWFDELVDDGAITPGQRAQLAAEDGAPTLTRLLRRAELAGHDPRQVLHDAVDREPLAGSRQITNVLHHRITEHGPSLDPVGDTYADWTPQVDDPQTARHLDTLANAADARRAELGDQVAAAQPQWAVEALGRIPTESSPERAGWEDRAGIVAAHRELTGYDDQETAIGPPPKAGQVEAYASWRAAWRALGRPDADGAEQQMTAGKLRMRVRAYDREKTWAPRYVANELAGTHQAAARHHETATLRHAEAQAAGDADTRTRLQREATEAAALADTLQQRAAVLDQADSARADWLVHTAQTRANADRARHELSDRDAAAGVDERLVTADEWLAEHQADQLAADVDRPVVDEHDLTHIVEQDDDDLRTITDVDDLVDVADDEPLVDIREATADEPAQDDTDVVRVPSPEETADTVAQAQRALAELDDRRAHDEQRAAEEARTEELTRWHIDDTTQAAAVERAEQLQHALAE